MRCEKVLEKVYEYSSDEMGDMPLITRIRIGLHIITCPDCAQELERFEVCRNIFYDEFSSPGMAMLDGGEGEIPKAEDDNLPGGFSTRGWVIAGLMMLVSLATAFFGLDFNKMAVEMGMSFMLPIGIIMGIVLTGYGAIFIGSHLKELTERFSKDA
jgi:hypothetical protein